MQTRGDTETERMRDKIIERKKWGGGGEGIDIHRERQIQR